MTTHEATEQAYKNGYEKGKQDALKWISVKDRLPEINSDGTVDAVLVTDGVLQHMAYFVDGWIFADSGEMKKPMFYEVTHWMPLPQPPKGE
jgi:hypothetical protein